MASGIADDDDDDSGGDAAADDYDDDDDDDDDDDVYCWDMVAHWLRRLLSTEGSWVRLPL